MISKMWNIHIADKLGYHQKLNALEQSWKVRVIADFDHTITQTETGMFCSENIIHMNSIRTKVNVTNWWKNGRSVPWISIIDIISKHPISIMLIQKNLHFDKVGKNSYIFVMWIMYLHIFSLRVLLKLSEQYWNETRLIPVKSR